MGPRCAVTENGEDNKVDKSTQVQVHYSAEIGEAIKIGKHVAVEALAGRIQNYGRSGSLFPTYSPPTTENTMARLASDVLEKHAILYTSMVNKLAPDTNNGYKAFKSVADYVFDDDRVTWGKIIALYALEARIVIYLGERNLKTQAMQTASFVGTYLGEKAECFIRENGGWNSLLKQYPQKCSMEEKVWKGLFGLGLGLGLAAVILKSH